MPRGLPVTTAYARSAPANAPATALTAEMPTLLTDDFTRYGLLIAVKVEKVRLPSLVVNDPSAMIKVGSSRNRPTYAKNGTTPSHEKGSRRPPRTGRAAALMAGTPADVNRWPGTSGRRRISRRRWI